MKGKKDKIKILNRFNSSFEKFSKLSIEQLLEVSRSNKFNVGKTEEHFRLSSTDKVALHKALKIKHNESKLKSDED